MKYLRVIVVSEYDEVLYKKDVDVRNVMEHFIRIVVSQLVRDGTIQTGDHYTASLIPRYGDTLRRSPVITIDKDQAKRPSRWLSLAYEEPCRPDELVRFFTLELRIKENGLIYRRDCQVHDVATEYSHDVSQTLLKLGQIASGDYYMTQFFARDDEHANFDREFIPGLQKQAEALVEIIDDGPQEPSFPERDPTSFGKVRAIGKIAADSIKIYVRSEAMELLAQEGQLSTEAERGGILVGNVFEDPSGGRRIVEVSDLIVGTHMESSVTELRYTFDTWQAQTSELRKRFPGKRIVGWYHTHLVTPSMYVDDALTKVEASSLFFSNDDVFLHTQFFPNEWYVAMVLDQQGNSIFFQWKNNDIEVCPGYFLFEDVGVADAGVGS